MAEAQNGNYLHDLILIDSNPELKEWLDAVRLARGQVVFGFLNQILPEEPSQTPFVLEAGDGTKTIASIRTSEEFIPEWRASVVVSEAQISNGGNLQVADGAITLSLLYPDNRGTLGYAESQKQPQPLFTVRSSGEIHGPVSDLDVIEGFLGLPSEALSDY